MRLKTYIFILLTLTVMLTGCTSQLATKQLQNLSNDEQILTVYLNDFDTIIGPLFEESTGYKINLVQGSGAEILSRIEAERGNPRWDVVWVDMISSIHGLGLNDMLYEDFIPSNASMLKDSFKTLVPERKWYYPTSAHASAVIVYNHDELHKNDAPRSWSMFADSKYVNAIGFSDPAIAAPAYSFVNWFFHHEGIDEGKALMQTWFDNGLHIYPKNPNVAMALTSGQIKVAALQESNAYMLLKQNHPVSIIWPEEGSPASIRVAAISKETKKLDAAKAFVDFLLDPAIQQHIIALSDDAYHEPSIIGVEQKADRKQHAKLLFPDTSWSYENEAEIKQWFADFSIK